MDSRKFILCADDYGLSPAISMAIISLLQSQRITATSCLVNMKHWQEHAKWLKPYRHTHDIGLHFNLTEGQPISHIFQSEYGKQFFSLPKMLSKSFLRTLNSQVIEAECRAQLDKFVSELGFLPDFIDGHQHIHQFPKIRNALIKTYLTYLKQNNTYIRLVQPKLKMSSWYNDIKSVIIFLATNYNVFRKLLLENHIPHNQTFSGLYAFHKPSKQYSDLFSDFLLDIYPTKGDEFGLILCHPADPRYTTNNTQDKILKARISEYEYFMSDKFINDCISNNASLVRGAYQPL